MTRVSVCIPTYNGAATIGETIASVLGQTWADFELIVVDDGSSDTTADIVRLVSDPRLRYLRNERNLGPQGNWNRCLELARGHYIKLLPHDDVLRADCLQRQVAALDADADARLALSCCAREVIGPDGRVLTTRGYPGAAGDMTLPSDAVRRACLRRGTNLLGEPGGVLFRRELATRVGPFDATHPYVIDLDYWFRLLAHGDVHYTEQPLVAFRVSRSQWSVAIGSSQSAEFRGFARRVLNSGALRAGLIDRLLGSVTPALNNLARLLFYRLYLR